MKINAIKCKTCKDTIFSRARHDCRSCSCGEIYVDGGFDYTRVGFTEAPPDSLEIEIEQTKKELYNDWATKKDKFGIIKEAE